MARNDETQRQVEHEELDIFKHQTVFPMINSEVEDSRKGPMTVLEIGPGSGSLADSLSLNGEDAVILLDTNQNLLGEAFAAYSDKSISTTGILGSVTQLQDGIKPGSVDVAIASFVLNQVEKIEIVSDLISGYLKPNGRFIVVVPDEAYVQNLQNNRPWKMDSFPTGVLHEIRSMFRFTSAEYDVPIYTRANSTYRSLLRRSGFAVSDFRIEDPDEEMIPATPKALMLVGRRMPNVLGKDLKCIVQTVEDRVWRATLEAVLISDNSDVAFMVISNGTTTEVDPIPIKRQSAGIERLIEIAMEKDGEVVIRRIRFATLHKDRTVIRLYDSNSEIVVDEVYDS